MSSLNPQKLHDTCILGVEPETHITTRPYTRALAHNLFEITLCQVLSMLRVRKGKVIYSRTESESDLME
jgi:hypothetical protein